MNTVQRYTGKGDNVPQSSQTAQNAQQVNASPDQRQGEPHPLDSIITDARLDLLSTVRDYWRVAGLALPVEAINELMYCWLITPNADLEQHDAKDHLYQAQLLINFLTKLFEESKRVELLEMQKGGLTNE